MKQKLLSAFVLFFTGTFILHSQTVWNGPTVTFTKIAFANPTLATSQDRITSSTWITRGNTQGIYNIASEPGFSHDVSPANTEWATGTLANYQSLSYQPWELWAGDPPTIPTIVGRQAVLHLIAENIYIGITFTSWSQGGGGGGGFSYQRTTAGTPAPVKLTSFTVAKKNNFLVLNWKTATEENTSSFTVERSADGRNFESIGNVAAAGNSSSDMNYAFNDLEPLPANFYRLRTNDKGGAVSYSNVVSFKMSKAGSLQLFPLPASHVLHVQMKAAEHSLLQIVDVAGRIMKCSYPAAGDSAFTIEIDNLKPGTYFLRAGKETKMFIKQ